MGLKEPVLVRQPISLGLWHPACLRAPRGLAATYRVGPYLALALRHLYTSALIFL